MKLMGISALILLAVAGNLCAQPCNETVLLTTPGKWTEGMKGSTSGISAVDLAREKAIVGKLHHMIQATYQPMGVDADYNGVYFRADPARPGNSFSYALRFMPYSCKENTVSRAHETSTSLIISVNEIALGPEIYEPFIDGSPWDAGFRSMRKLPVEKAGVYFYEEETSLGFSLRGPQYTWLITRDGQLPFQLVTQKEFLEKKKAKLKAGKQQEIERIKETLTTRPPAEQDERLQKATKGFDAALAKIDGLLTRSAPELQQTAIVKQDPNDFLSHLFTTPDDPFANVLIKPNPAYFNPKHPRSSPQFIAVVLKGYDKNPVYGKAMKDVQQSLDFTKLKAMLEK